MFGFKAFLADSGVPEFPPLDPDQLAEALAAVDALFVVHAEDPDHLHAAALVPGVRGLPGLPAAGRRARRGRHRDRRGPRSPGARVHILHLSAATALPLIAAAKAEGVRVTAETCPHYLTLDAGRHPGRRDRVQVLPADPRRRQRRPALGRRSPTA